jgi:hypothetical protein
MTEDTFDFLEDTLHLHPATLQALLSAAGTFSKHTDRDDDDSVKTKRIQILLKVPQKYEIANYGISVSFDVHSRMTTALLFGESVTNFVYDRQKATAQPHTPDHVSPFNRLVEYLKNSRLSWDHPLLLPSALLADHLSRTRAFCEIRLAAKVYQMEKKIDVTHVGLRNDFGEEGLSPDFRAEDLDFDPAPLFDRKRVLGLTVRLNTLYTRVLFTQGSPTWNKEASQFLGRIHEEMPRHMRKTKNGYALSELLEYNANVARALEGVVSSLQSRMELQLNILYSFTSQSDNRINERIALNSGRDSTSMKILALISAFFLPGTFVATLFSMSMFQWQPNGGGGDVVSEKFWIYWAAAVPLTAITVIGWGVWWKRELNQYDKTMSKQVSSNGPSFVLKSDEADFPQQGVTMQESHAAKTDGGSIKGLITSKTWRTNTKDIV